MSGSPASGDQPDGLPRAPWGVWVAVGAGLLALVLVIVLVAINLPAGQSTPRDTPVATAQPTPTPGETAEGDPTPTPPVSAEPVPIDESATITEGLTAGIDQLEAVDGEARGPGEVAGPAIRFRVSIENATSASVDLRGTVVTVDYGDDRTPALQLFEPGAVPMPASVDAGKTATGVYIFTIPVDQRDDVRITVDYAVGVAPLEFTGSVPRP